jgi:pimeloyl-ACP methyl ester carboxylesterase
MTLKSPQQNPEAGPPLAPPFQAERRETDARAGPMTHWVTGQGAPLLVLHSINAAASAAEIRPIVEHARTDRRVWAPDLPGFGFSSRRERDYTIRLYVDAVHDALDAIEAEHGAQPVDAIALSLSAEFLARAAAERPQRLRSLTLITPTGFSRGAERMRGEPGASREVPGIHRTVSGRPWSRGLFNLLVSRPSIRFFLRKTWGSADIDNTLADYCHASAHQPGARHAPFAFLSARLFSRDIRNVYESLRLPVLLAHGTRGDFRDFSQAAWTHSRPNWRVQAFDTGAMLHFEQPEAFMRLWREFIDQPPSAQGLARKD